MTQKEAVILTLNKQGSMTSWEGFQDWGITRLAAIIPKIQNEFKMRGYYIDPVPQKSKNRFGHTTNYVKYVVKPMG